MMIHVALEEKKINNLKIALKTDTKGRHDVVALIFLVRGVISLRMVTGSDNDKGGKVALHPKGGKVTLPPSREGFQGW